MMAQGPLKMTRLCLWVLFLGWLSEMVKLHKCIHSEIVKRMGSSRLPTLEQSEDSDQATGTARRLQYDTWRNINVHLDFSNVNTADPIKKSFIKDILTKEVVRRVQSFIQVNGPKTIKAFRATKCEEFSPTPVSFHNQATTADLILIVSAQNEDSDYIAYAAPCLLNAQKRPVVGAISINLKNLSISKDSVDSFVSSMFHEIIHVLVFSPELFDYFATGGNKAYVVEKRTTSRGTFKVTKIVTPGILGAGRAHYNCPSFSGMYLENEGDDGSMGSHFEKLLGGNEIMTSQATGKMVLSAFTLNLLNDSGWYKIDMDYAEPLYWGKGQGCNFLKSACNSNDREFCSTENQVTCSPDHRTKTKCLATDFADKCLINEILLNSNCNIDYGHIRTSLYESFGQNSRCLMTQRQNHPVAGCYEARCAQGSIDIVVSNSTLRCSKAGQTLTYGDLTIVCPDIQNFCASFEESCPGDCSGSGKCLSSKKCYCDFFTSGPKCEIENICGLDAEVCAAISSVQLEDAFDGLSSMVARLNPLLSLLYIIVFAKILLLS